MSAVIFGHENVRERAISKRESKQYFKDFCFRFSNSQRKWRKSLRAEE